MCRLVICWGSKGRTPIPIKKLGVFFAFFLNLSNRHIWFPYNRKYHTCIFLRSCPGYLVISEHRRCSRQNLPGNLQWKHHKRTLAIVNESPISRVLFIDKVKMILNTRNIAIVYHKASMLSVKLYSQIVYHEADSTRHCSTPRRSYASEWICLLARTALKFANVHIDKRLQRVDFLLSTHSTRSALNFIIWCGESL